MLHARSLTPLIVLGIFVCSVGITAQPAMAQKNGPSTDPQNDSALYNLELALKAGDLARAMDALNSLKSADLYNQAATFLLNQGQFENALTLLDHALKTFPAERQLLLTKATTLDFLKRPAGRDATFAVIESRWPQWDRVFAIHGIVLQTEYRYDEAKRLLERAIALHTELPAVYYYEALSIVQTSPGNLDQAWQAISKAIALDADDPWFRVQAGKISIARKDYSEAIRNLKTAVKLQPALLPAHYALRLAYMSAGDQPLAAEESKIIERIGADHTGTDEGQKEQNEHNKRSILSTGQPPG
jgi:tetratricopeptide (TPR) repeat protein